MTTTTATTGGTTLTETNDGAKGLSGSDGANGSGFVDGKYSQLNNPLLRLFDKNNIAHTHAGAFSFLRASTATYKDRYGVIKYAAIDEPRQELDGWLFEGASINLALRSEDFSHAIWTKSNATATFGAISPDLTANATTFTSTGGFALFQQLIAGRSIGETFTASFWVRRKTGTGAISLRAGEAALLDVTSSVGSEWSRVSAQGVPLTSTICRLAMTLSTIGDEVEVWGAQIEQLPFASSYIPTTTTEVTRAADDCTIDMYNNVSALSSVSDEMDVFIAAKTTQGGTIYDTDLSIGATGISASLTDVTIEISTEFPASSGIYTADTQSIGKDTSAPFTIVGKFESERAILSEFQGSNITYANIPAPVDYNGSGKIHIGKNRLSANNFYGYISSVRIYDFTLTPNQIDFLTKL